MILILWIYILASWTPERLCQSILLIAVREMLLLKHLILCIFFFGRENSKVWSFPKLYIRAKIRIHFIVVFYSMTLDAKQIASLFFIHKYSSYSYLTQSPKNNYAVNYPLLHLSTVCPLIIFCSLIKFQPSS